MKFRPCIDIHNGAVKQIVGNTLRDAGDSARENFVSARPASYYAELFRRDGLTGGHIILLNAAGSSFYEATKQEALGALAAYPGGMQVGGGVNADNAASWLRAGASHVIVTSFVFREGRIDWENLGRLERAAGANHIVLDLSCRYFPEEAQYFIMTDRWQRRTETPLDKALMEDLMPHCAEFLIHAVDVEGKERGIDARLVRLVAETAGFPVTYAGGIRSLADIAEIESAGNGNIDFTVGSALDIYGGKLPYREIAVYKG